MTKYMYQFGGYRPHFGGYRDYAPLGASRGRARRAGGARLALEALGRSSAALALPGLLG